MAERLISVPSKSKLCTTPNAKLVTLTLTSSIPNSIGFLSFIWRFKVVTNNLLLVGGPVYVGCTNQTVSHSKWCTLSMVPVTRGYISSSSAIEKYSTLIHNYNNHAVDLAFSHWFLKCNHTFQISLK